MDDLPLAAYRTNCNYITSRVSWFVAADRECLRRSQEALTLSRTLLAQPVYPYDCVRPHNPFDFSGLMGEEPGHLKSQDSPAGR